MAYEPLASAAEIAKLNDMLNELYGQVGSLIRDHVPAKDIARHLPGTIKAIAVGKSSAVADPGTAVTFPTGRFSSTPFVAKFEYYITASGGVPSWSVSIRYQLISATGFTAVVPAGQPATEFFWIAVELYPV